MFDQRRVSQERVIGISFVDILIQAVFVLLIALIVGYVDPVVKIEMEAKSEYGQIGKDLCHKLNKDSLQACREYVEGKKIAVESNDRNLYSGIGEDYCRSIGATDAEECRKYSETNLSKLRPCLRPKDRFTIPSTVTFSLSSPSQIEFKGFSPMFLLKLEADNDVVRLEKAKRIAVGFSLAPQQIDGVFGFIREPSCFHKVSVLRPGRYSDEDLRAAHSALSLLGKPAE